MSLLKDTLKKVHDYFHNKERKIIREIAMGVIPNESNDPASKRFRENFAYLNCIYRKLYKYQGEKVANKFLYMVSLRLCGIKRNQKCYVGAEGNPSRVSFRVNIPAEELLN